MRIADTYFIFTGECLLFSSGILNIEEERLQKQQEPSNAASPGNAVRPMNGARRPAASGLQNKDDGRLIINITERSAVQRFKKMLLLQDINLSVSNGEMVLILGGSGAGKTTFVNAVMGYEKASGKILYRAPISMPNTSR